MRETTNVALLAFLASRTASRPLVAEMAGHIERAGICDASLVMGACDERSTAALEAWCSTLPQGVSDHVRRTISGAAQTAAARWESWCVGEEPATDEIEEASPAIGSRRPGAAVVPDLGSEDPEHPAASRGSGIMKLQRDLVRVTDAALAYGLVQQARASGAWNTEQRLFDLSDTKCSHEWLWNVSPHKGKTMSHSEYVMAVRVRLGCAGPDEPLSCSSCEGGILERSGRHCLLCAKGESTRGHNAVRDEIFAMAKGVDGNAETEPVGLIPSHPALRPADILTSASGLTGRLAALDVGIISPAAAGAGTDCTETMRVRKCRRMEPFADELEAGDVTYRPITFSCFGRPHSDAFKVIQCLAQRTARRRGTEAHVEQRRMMTRITHEIWRRAGRMVLRCWPVAEYEDDGEDQQIDVTAEARIPPRWQ